MDYGASGNESIGERYPPISGAISCLVVSGVLRSARSSGVPQKLTPEQIEHARKLIDKGEARQYVADLLNVGRSTLYRALAD